MDYESLKSIAPRKSGEVDLPNGDKLKVYALDLAGRLGFTQYIKERPGDHDMAFAYCAVHGCPALAGQTPEEVVFSIDGMVLADIGGMVLDLSGLTEKDAEEAEKNSESGPD